LELFMSESTFYDVIISGAGPVGLFLACELALAKCTVLVLEKALNPESPLKRIPFGIRGLNAPSIEAFYRRGLLEELDVHTRMKSPHQNTGEGERRQVGHFAGIPFHFGDIDFSFWNRLSSSTDTSLISEMEELEIILSRRAFALGVHIKRGMTVLGFHQNDEGVIVNSDQGSYIGGWLVGCDGARSAVRKAGSFEFVGTDPEFTGYSTKVDIEDPEKLRPGRNVTADGMYMQSQPGYMILQDFDAGAFHSSGKEITVEHVQDVLRRISNTDVTINALHIATTWTDRTLQATVYRRGRVFLAGDAAHIHSPLGGQGLNLGLGDAMNLGWKLAATIHGNAPKGLLDSYSVERHPVGEQVLNWSRAQVAIMKPKAESRALYTIVRDLMNTRDGATYFAGKVWGVSLQYNLGDDHPLVGKSVPNFELEDGVKLGELMHSGQAILLDFSENASLKGLATEYGDQIRYISKQPKTPSGLDALLIRPDGFVAWASDNGSVEKGVQHVAEKWFFKRVQ
jgi:2-polyprenyl-6-methoxyphenol hydroxylase-like FAD-dependent oxidoreductase